MKNRLFDQENFNQQLIMAACANLVTDEGFTPREVFELLEEMKGQLWPALSEMKREVEDFDTPYQTPFEYLSAKPGQDT